jgi:hypothetical protein
VRGKWDALEDVERARDLADQSRVRIPFSLCSTTSFCCSGLIADQSRLPNIVETCLTPLEIVEYCRNLS